MLYGDLVLKGIAGNLDAKLKGRVINLQSSFPDLAYNIDYSAENYSDGIVSIKDFDIINKKLWSYIRINWNS